MAWLSESVLTAAAVRCPKLVKQKTSGIVIVLLSTDPRQELPQPCLWILVGTAIIKLPMLVRVRSGVARLCGSASHYQVNNCHVRGLTTSIIIQPP